MNIAVMLLSRLFHVCIYLKDIINNHMSVFDLLSMLFAPSHFTATLHSTQSVEHTWNRRMHKINLKLFGSVDMMKVYHHLQIA